MADTEAADKTPPASSMPQRLVMFGYWDGGGGCVCVYVCAGVCVPLTEQRRYKADAAAEHRSTRHIQLRQHGEGEQRQAHDMQQFKECDLIGRQHLASLSILEATITHQRHFQAAGSQLALEHDDAQGAQKGEQLGGCKGKDQGPHPGNLLQLAGHCHHGSIE